MLTSGIFGELYVINTEYYNIEDDMCSFRSSKSYNSLPIDCYIEEGLFELKYGKEEELGGRRYVIHWSDERQAGTSEFRVYVIRNAAMRG